MTAVGKTILLLSCVKEKCLAPCRALEFYQGFFFSASLKHGLGYQPDEIFILSGKYGLVSPNQILEPYDLNLTLASREYQERWSRRVLADLRRLTRIESDRFVILAEPAYRDGLIPYLNNFDLPFLGKTLEQQLEFYRKNYRS